MDSTHTGLLLQEVNSFRHIQEAEEFTYQECCRASPNFIPVPPQEESDEEDENDEDMQAQEKKRTIEDDFYAEQNQELIMKRICIRIAYLQKELQSVQEDVALLAKLKELKEKTV
jgi:hypothetical protein